MIRTYLNNMSPLAVLLLAFVCSCGHCDIVRDARVGAMYVGQGGLVKRKDADPDNGSFGGLEQSALDMNRIVHSSKSFGALTYVATKVVARDALGGGNVDRVQVYQIRYDGAPEELVGEFVASWSSTPALTVHDGELYCAWITYGSFGHPHRIRIRHASNGRNWSEVADIDLDDRLDFIDIASYGNSLLLAGATNSAVSVRQLRLSSPALLATFSIWTAARKRPVGRVSLAVKADLAVVIFGEVGTLMVNQACIFSSECRTSNCSSGVCQGALGVGEPCNLHGECGTHSCVWGACAGPVPNRQPGFVRMRGLSLAGASLGDVTKLWDSPRQADLRWVSGTRVTEASGETSPNDFIVAGMRSLQGDTHDIHHCIWPWPSGSPPVLAPADCSIFHPLGDANLRPGIDGLDSSKDLPFTTYENVFFRDSD